MSFFSLHRLVKIVERTVGRHPGRVSRRWVFRRPFIEHLEDRIAPATLTATDVANWVESLQYKNPNTNPRPAGYGAIREAQGLGVDPKGVDAYEVDPYFANLAVSGLLQSGAPGALNTASLWIQWYLKNLDPAATIQNYTIQTIQNYWYDASGNFVATSAPDSQDAYAATFLSVCWQYLQAGGNPAAFAGAQQTFENIGSVILGLQDTDGLVWASRSYQVKYLQDNSEDYAGLLAMSQLETDVFQNPTGAVTYLAAAQQVQQGIQQYLYDPTHRLFDWALGNPANLSVWYPDTVALMWPALFGVIGPDSLQAQDQLNALGAWNSGTSNWTDNVLDTSGFDLWPSIGYAALLGNDAGQGQAQIQWVYQKADFSGGVPTYGYFTNADGGWLLLGLNTIAGTYPTSTVTALPADSPTTFTVSWSGQDYAGGPGIASYSVYVSDNSGPFEPFVTDTTAGSAAFTGQPGHSYGFYSIVVDQGGGFQPPPSQAQATTQVGPDSIVVTTASDLVGHTGTSLRDAVAQANADAAAGISASITFAPSLNGDTITLTQGELELTAGTGTTTIKGGGQVTISGNNASRVFQVDPGAHDALTGLSIVNGLVGNGTGAGINNAGTLSLNSVTLAGNSAINFWTGGGIANTGTLSVSNSQFSGNSAADFGGGLDNSGTLTVSGTTFSNNSAFIGGAIDNELGATSTVENSTFSGNSASAEGGAAYNSGVLTGLGDTFSGNSASEEGGAILNGNTGLGNGQTAPGQLTLSDVTLYGNSAVTRAGAIDNYGVANITYATIAGNSVSNGEGGGIDEVTSNANSLTLTDSIVADNIGSAPDISGAVASASSNNLIGNGTGMTGISNDDANHNQVGTSSSPMNPLLSALGNYGGLTQTMTLLPGSPAIGAGLPVAGITIDQRGIGRPAGYSDLGAVQDQGFTLTVNSGDSPQSADVNTGFANPLAVTVTSAYGEPVVGGVVSYGVPASGASASLSSLTAIIDSNGQASVAATANGTPGSYAVVASASGVLVMSVPPPGTFNLTNQATPVVTVNPVNITYGTALADAQLSGTATVKGTDVPGSFSFVSAGGSLLSAGNAQTEQVVFTPNDSTDYVSVTANVTVNVSSASTTMLLTSSADPSLFGQPVTFTATLSANLPGSATPSGSVTFEDTTTNTNLGSVPLNGGTAGLTPALLNAGTHVITATYYDPEGNYLGSSASLTQSVGAVTAANLQQVLSPSSPVTIMASTNTDADNVISAVNQLPPSTGGTETVTLVLAAGSYADLNASPPAGVTLVINGNGTSTTIVGHSPALTVSSGTVSVNGVIFTTATDAPTILVSGGSLTLTNDFVQESAGYTDAAISVIGGTLDLGTMASPGGNTLNVNGTGEFVQNTTGSLVPAAGNTFEINGVPRAAPFLSFTSLAASPTSTIPGQPVALTATVAPDVAGSATPTGSVDFYDTSTNTDLGKVSLSGGAAALSTATLALGTNVIQATYQGDGNYLLSLASVTATVTQSIYVLNDTAGGSLTLSGNGDINIPGTLVVDSNSKTALTEIGSASINAASIQVVGGVSQSGNATLSPAPVTAAASVADPLAGLAVSTGGTSQGSVKVSGNGSLTINPGIYSSISVSGSATLTLNPGVYILAGGGLTATGNASISGSGVTLYNTESAFPNPGGTYCGITLSGNGIFNLTAPSSGPYAGVVIFQARTNTRAISLGGNATKGLTGTVYAPAALLYLNGNASLAGSVVVNELSLSGNAASTQAADGSDVSAGDTAGQLLAGNVTVYVDNSNGLLTSDELARIQDAVTAVDAVVEPFGVSVTETTDCSQANVIVDMNTTSPVGGYADGILGCWKPAGEITLIQGWNWYAGSDPTQIGASQYDFETTLTHELGHALGLGESTNLTSAMYGTLAPGKVIRTLTTADLNIPYDEAGPDPQRAAPLPAPATAPVVPAVVATAAPEPMSAASVLLVSGARTSTPPALAYLALPVGAPAAPLVVLVAPSPTAIGPSATPISEAVPAIRFLPAAVGTFVTGTADEPAESDRDAPLWLLNPAAPDSVSPEIDGVLDTLLGPRSQTVTPWVPRIRRAATNAIDLVFATIEGTERFGDQLEVRDHPPARLDNVLEASWAWAGVLGLLASAEVRSRQPSSKRPRNWLTR